MNIELTQVERTAIRRTWEIARKDLSHNGMNLLIAVFHKNPEKQSLFQKFKNVPVHHLKSSRAFIAQSSSVMTSLDAIVGTIDPPHVMKEKMIQVGRYHKMRKAHAKVQDFQDFNNVLLDAFPIMMAKEWSHDAELGWTKVLSMLMMNVAIGLDT